MTAPEEERLPCPSCGGKGSSTETCPLCHGERTVLGVRCWGCQGTGKKPCPTCQGKGWIPNADADR